MLRRHKAKLTFTKEMLNLPGPIKTIGMVSFVYTLGWAIVDPFFFIYLKQLFGDYASVGFLTALVYLLAIVWALPIGQLLNRVSGKLMLAATLVLYFPMGYLLITLTTFTQFVFLKIFNSFTAASVWVSFEDYVREHVDRKRVYEAFGLFDALISLAYVIGPILGALLLMRFGFKMFFVISITSFIAFLLALTLKDHKKENMFRGIKDTITKDGFVKKEFKDLWRNKKLVKVELISFLFTFASTAMIMLVPLFLNEQKASYLQIGIISALYYLPSMSESYFSTLKSKKKLAHTGIIISMLLLIGMFFISNLYVLFALVLLLSLCMTAVYSVLRGVLSNCMPKKEAGELSGVDMSIRYTAGGLGLLISGFVAQITGLKSVFIMMAIILSAILILSSKKEFKFCNFSGK
ncbi:MAG: MFS transporter [archaeon]